MDIRSVMLTVDARKDWTPIFEDQRARWQRIEDEIKKNCRNSRSLNPLNPHIKNYQIKQSN
jgi:hypothetical protein